MNISLDFMFVLGFNLKQFTNITLKLNFNFPCDLSTIVFAEWLHWRQLRCEVITVVPLLSPINTARHYWEICVSFKQGIFGIISSIMEIDIIIISCLFRQSAGIRSRIFYTICMLSRGSWLCGVNKTPDILRPCPWVQYNLWIVPLRL